MSSLEVQKFAIKYDPPTFVIQYRNNETGKNFLKNIRLRIGRKANAGKVTDKIISENPDLLGPSKVSQDQIRDLIELIIGKSCISSEKPPMKSSQQPVAIEYGDLNKATDVVIEKAKSEMNVNFEANRIQPNDKNYVWDKKVDFAPPVGTSDWDEDDD